MKDKSKRLTVVNTGKKPSEKKEVQQIVVQPSSSSSSHAPGFNPNLYLLKSVWDSVFEIKTDGSGQKYIFGKLPVVTKYGITMYADDGNVDIPQLAEGLPFDQRTIWFNPETKQIEVIGGTGGGGEGGVSNFWDLSGIPSWITNTKPVYNYNEIKNTPDLSVFVTGSALSNTLADYATLTYLTGELKKYVTSDGAQDIKGVKNFVNGLKIANMPITKLQDDVIYIDANLVVRGGITMYGDGEGGSSVPSYSTLGSLENVDKDSIDAVASVDRVLFQSAGSNVWSWKALSEIGGGGGSVSGAVRYLSTLGSTGSWYDSTYRLYGEWGLHDRLYLKTEGGYDVVANLAEKDGNGNVIASTYLPLSGGTINGAGDYLYVPLFVNALNNQISGITFQTNGTERGHVGYHYELGMRLHTASTAGIAVSNSDVPIFYTQDGAVKNTILHSGNYSSYALPLSGGTLNGDLCLKNEKYIKVYDTSGNSLIAFHMSGGNNLHVGHDIATKGYNTYISGKTIYLQTYENAFNIAMSINSNGKVGIGTTSPTQPLHVVGNIATYVPSTNDPTASIDFANTINDRWQISGRFNKNKATENNKLNTYYYNGSTWEAIMTLQTNGNVGIGTTTPAYKLDVNGTIRFASKTIWGQSFDGTGNINGILTLNYNSSTAGIELTREGSNECSIAFNNGYGRSVIGSWGGSTILWIQSVGNVISANMTTGNVGIGTTSPAEKLDINGHMIIRGAGDNLASINLYNSSTSLWQISARFTSSDKNLKLYYYNGSTYNTYLTISQSGGNMLVAGGVTMYSDIRKKTILNHVELSLKQIADAPLIEHYYNSDQDKTTHVGSIAQYWAGLNDWFCKLDSEGFYTMEIQNCALASAISIARHLEKYESKTDKTIRKMKQRIQELEDEVERLKKGA